MTYLDYWTELLGAVPGLPAPLAQRLVNRAWRQIQESRPWSFMMKEGVIEVPGQITAGTASVTEDSSTVTLDATAQAAWDAAGLHPPVTLRQFRVGGGPLYSVTAYSSGAVTLDRPYQGATNASALYSLYRAYYQPEDETGAPATDFLRYHSVYDPSLAYSLFLDHSFEELNRRDPQRSATGQPYYLATRSSDASTGVPTYEMWPHPTAATTLLTVYRRRWSELVDDDDTVPAVIGDDLLMTAARLKAYEWAEANKGAIPELRYTNWVALRAALTNGTPGSDDGYRSLLARAKAQDEETHLNAFRVGPGLGRTPVDAGYLQKTDAGF